MTVKIAKMPSAPPDVGLSGLSVWVAATTDWQQPSDTPFSALSGGDYRPGGVGANRTAQEQHPFHLHGHHFWLLGQGMGIYNDSVNGQQLNTANPPFRDSFTIFKGGWVVLRFKVSNLLTCDPVLLIGVCFPS